MAQNETAAPSSPLEGYQESFFDALGRRSRDFALVADANAEILWVSAAVESMFGYSREQVMHRAGWDFVHEDDQQRVREVYANVVESGGTATVELRVQAADGSWHWVEEVITNLLDTPIGGIVCNLIDVTHRRQMEQQLALEQARNLAIVETAQEGLVLTDPDGQTVFANRRMAEMLGLSLGQLYEQPMPSLLSRPQKESVKSRLGSRVLRGREEYELSYEHPDGSTRWLHVAVAPIAYGEAESTFHGSLATVIDVTELRVVEAELRQAALRDPLTGLPNRALLSDRLQQALLRQAHDGSGRLCVMLVDLDQFKLLNASLGHDFGDAVLKEVARRLTDCLPQDSTVARIGGDEFVVVSTVDSPEEGQDLAELVLRWLSEPIQVEDHLVTTSASIGVTLSPPESGEDLLRNADTAMFAAKAAGRGRIKHFDDELAARAKEAYRIVNDLVSAFSDSSLSLHYQPILELAAGHVVGFEALIRWNHPELGLICPSEFVPIAERAGLSRRLDRWVVTRSLADFARLRAMGEVDRSAYVAINLSAQELGHRDVEPFLVEAVERSGVPPENVVFEVTEGAIMYDQGEAVRLLRSLRDRGFGIALDDFGTGQSSLANLRKLPVSVIKIDRTFIDDMAHDHDAKAIVTSVLRMASSIGVPVTAEGVESEVQAAALRRLGCTAAQGWLWSPARTIKELHFLPRQFALPASTRGNGHPIGPAIDVGEEHGRHRMLELQEEGASLASIAAALNNEGYRTPSGRRWQVLSVARAITGIA